MMYRGGYKMASSVPIPPISSSQSLTDLMSSDKFQPNLSTYVNKAASSKDSGLSSTQQSSLSPVNYTQSTSPNFIPSVSATDSMGLSPFDANSPSPQMWQTSNMDMDENMDIKLEPFDNFDMLGANDDNLLDFLNNSIDDGSVIQSSELDSYINNANEPINVSNTSNFPIGLDPQHSSPAAMNLVRPDDIMSNMGSTNSSGQMSSSFQGFSSVMDSNGSTNILFPTKVEVNVAPQPHSFTSTNFLPQHQMLPVNNNPNNNNNIVLHVQQPSFVGQNAMKTNVIKPEITSPETVGFGSSPVGSVSGLVPHDDRNITSIPQFVSNEDLDSTGVRFLLTCYVSLEYILGSSV